MKVTSNIEPLARRAVGYLSVLFFCLLFIFPSRVVNAQQYFKKWTTENGLPQNNVLYIAQTADGYLWLSTADGLARFDGIRFKVFNKSNTPEMPNNRMDSMFTDAAGRLWFGYPGDQTVVVYENGKFKAFEKGRDFEKDEDGDPTSSLNKERNRRLLQNPEMIFRAGETEYVYENGHFLARPAQKQGSPSRVFATDNKSVWIDDREGLYHVKDEKLTRYGKNIPPPVDLKQTYPVDSAERDGVLWFISGELNAPANNRLLSFKDGKLKSFPLTTGLQELEFDDKGNLWVTFYEKGLARIDAEAIAQNDPTSFPVQENLPERGWRLFRDRDHNLWFGGQEGFGLINPDPAVTVYSRKTGLSADNVYPIVQDGESTIWFAAWNDKLYSYRNGRFSSETALLLTSLFVDSQSRLWRGSNGADIYYREKNKWVPVDFRKALPLQGSDKIKFGSELAFISEDKEGNMWFGAETGLVRYASGSSQLFTANDELPSNFLTSYLFTRSGEMWVGTNSGVARMENGRFRAFTEKEGLAGNYTRSFYEDAEGTIWIGGYDGGLTRYKNGIFTKITKRDGLFSDGVFVILEDDAGWFWMNSNQGIYRVRKQELNDFADGKTESVTSVSYGPEDGLMDVEGNGGKQPAGLKAKDGKLWFPMAHGVAVIDPKTVKRTTQPPPVLIEEAQIDQKPFDISADGIRLEPNQVSLEIDYTALGFVGAERMRFRYRLEGLDEQWTEAGTRRTAYFSHLPYGTYNFRVIAANYDGVWNNEGAVVKIVVVPPFYREWWFYALAILGVIGLITIVYFNRLRRLQALSETRAEFARRLIESQESERRRIAAELHDSIGQSLAMIKNRAVFTQMKVSDQETKEHLEIITQQTSQTIHEVREISYNLRPYLLERLGLTQSIKSLLDEVSDVGQIKIEAEIDDIDGLFNAEKEMNLYRILQESLNNIVKHSEAEFARVSIKKENSSLTISVEDTGKGFNLNNVAQNGYDKGGFGLIGMSERVRMLSGRYSIESAPGAGTKISIVIYLDKTI